jgi:hypothetical protein
MRFVKTAWRPLRLSLSPLPLSTRHADLLERVRSPKTHTVERMHATHFLVQRPLVGKPIQASAARRTAARVAEDLFDEVPFSERGQSRVKNVLALSLRELHERRNGRPIGGKWLARLVSSLRFALARAHPPSASCTFKNQEGCAQATSS